MDSLRTAKEHIPCESTGTIKTSKDTSGNEASETRSQHVSGVEDRHPCGNLFLGIEQRQEEECTRIELFILGQPLTSPRHSMNLPGLP